MRTADAEVFVESEPTVELQIVHASECAAEREPVGVPPATPTARSLFDPVVAPGPLAPLPPRPAPPMPPPTPRPAGQAPRPSPRPRPVGRVKALPPGAAAALPDGAPPGPEYTIKGNAGSMLFHAPDSPYYSRTKAEMWFRTAADARAAGFTEWTQKRRR